MVDEGRVARLLRGVDERVARLVAGRELPDGRRSEPLWLDGIKYLFVTAIEGCIDAAHHIIASERWAAVDSNAAAFGVLRDHEVLTASTASQMSAAVGFRNVLVHQYARVDDERVIAFLERDLGVLTAYTGEVSAWMLAHGGAATPGS